MTAKTFIPGKDSCLEDTIGKATGLLDALDIATETVSWLNPAPGCWSVHLQASACPHLYTNGKGTSRLACHASALGEFFERLQTNFFFAEYYLDEDVAERRFLHYPDERWFPPGDDGGVPVASPDGTELLDQELRALYDPDGELRAEHLRDNNTDPAKRAICALPFKDLADGRTVFFPVSLLNNLYVSNGMAAGNTRAECGAQALSEIIERYVKNIIISKGVSLPDVPAAVLANHPGLCAILATLAEHGFAVRVKDGSLGGRFPVICALLADTRSGGTYAAFGANCRFETAIERTLTELLQGRSLDSLRHFHPPSHDLQSVADPFNLESHFVDSDGLLAWSMFRDKADFPFTPWDFHGPTGEEFTRLAALIRAEGFSLYRAEYDHCGLYSCRLLAPGMSEIYPIDDMVWNNRATGGSLRRDLLRLPKMKRRDLAGLLDRLEALGLNDHQLVAGCIGVLFDESSPWATLRFGELKAMLHLALGNREDAAEWCGWCLDYAGLPSERLRLYRLLHTLLGFALAGEDVGGFAVGIRQFYREQELEEARRIIAGRTSFPGLTFGRTWRETSAAHARLLALYDQLQEIKRKYWQG